MGEIATPTTNVSMAKARYGRYFIASYTSPAALSSRFFDCIHSSKVQIVDGLPFVGDVSHDEGVIELHALRGKLCLV